MPVPPHDWKEHMTVDWKDAEIKGLRDILHSERLKFADLQSTKERLEKENEMGDKEIASLNAYYEEHTEHLDKNKKEITELEEKLIVAEEKIFEKDQSILELTRECHRLTTWTQTINMASAGQLNHALFASCEELANKVVTLTKTCATQDEVNEKAVAAYEKVKAEFAQLDKDHKLLKQECTVLKAINVKLNATTEKLKNREPRRVFATDTSVSAMHHTVLGAILLDSPDGEMGRWFQECTSDGKFKSTGHPNKSEACIWWPAPRTHIDELYENYVYWMWHKSAQDGGATFNKSDFERYVNGRCTHIPKRDINGAPVPGKWMMSSWGVEVSYPIHLTCPELTDLAKPPDWAYPEDEKKDEGEKKWPRPTLCVQHVDPPKGFVSAWLESRDVPEGTTVGPQPDYASEDSDEDLDQLAADIEDSKLTAREMRAQKRAKCAHRGTKRAD